MKYFRNFIQVSLVAAILAFVTLPIAVSAQAQDCDANAIIRCGATSQASLQQKYAQNQNGNVQQIYSLFGVSNAGSLDGLVVGQVTRDNRVLVDGKVVATNAVTTGRQRISAADVPILGGAAFSRPPSVSFRSSALAAFVKMDGSRFVFAVIMTCGNPVKGTPTKEKPPVVTPPVFTCDLLEVNKLGDRKYAYKVNYSASNGATFKSLSYDFGDNTKVTDSQLNPIEHTYQTAGNFATTATVTFTVVTHNPEVVAESTESVSGPNCAKPITITKENCLVKGKENYPKDSPECKEAVVKIASVTPPPAALVNTGSGNILAVFFATMAAGTLAYKYRLGRKLNR